MARNAKSNAKAERADHRLPRDERLDREAAAGLLPLEDVARRADSRLTLGDIKRAAAKAKGVMGSSKKLDPSLKIAKTREHAASSSGAADGMKRSRGAAAAKQSLDKGRDKKGAAAAERIAVRRTRSNAEIAEGVTATARRSPAPRAARIDAGAAKQRSAKNKRTGGVRQRAPAPGNVTTITKREAVTGRKQAKKTGVRSTSSTGGRKPPKRSARAGTARGGSRPKGGAGNTTMD